MTDQTSIQTDLNRMQAEKTDAYLVAGCINLYLESLRRKCGRVVFGPADIDRLFTIIALFLDIHTVTNSMPAARTHEPTVDERAQILDVAPPESEVMPNEVKSLRRKVG